MAKQKVAVVLILTAATALRIVNAGGTPVNQYGIYIEDLTVGATADYGIFIAGADTAAIWVNSADPIHVGLAGTATGKMEWDGATSGTVTMTVGAAAGTWTLTLPAAVGGAGEQLTDAGGNGIASWAAAGSMKAFKNIGERLDPVIALKRIVETPVSMFRYKDVPKAITTGDFKTEYTGVMADDMPEVMHFDGKIFSPVSAFGMTAGAIQALEARVKQLESA